MSSQQNSPPQFDDADGSDPAGAPPTYAFNTQVMVGGVVLLFVIIFVILTIHLYVRRFLRRSSGSFTIRRGIAPSSSQSHNTGLDKAVIALLPTFAYSLPSPVDESVITPATECAVCLSEFQENEKVRMLPACKHIFHTECIDMWFSSHSTCPLCRTDVVSVTEALTEPPISTDQQQQEQEAMEPSQVNPNNGLHVGIFLHEPSTNESLPMSLSMPMRAVPQITIDIPPIESSNVFGSVSDRLPAKDMADQEAGPSQSLKSPSLRASIKRMLSRQSSRHRSPRQDGNLEISST